MRFERLLDALLDRGLSRQVINDINAPTSFEGDREIPNVAAKNSSRGTTWLRLLAMPVSKLSSTRTV